MSIELNLDRIATALEAIASAMTQAEAAPAPVPKPKPQPKPAPLPVEPEPEQPAFMAPPTPQTPSAPFTDNTGLVSYVMGKYKALGPVKGAMIQQALAELGHTNISNLKSDQYLDFFLKVESL